MPLYEYVCQQCQQEFEELIFTSDEIVHCPKCHSDHIMRKISVPGMLASKTDTLPTYTQCETSGPPCGPRCSRFQA